MKRESKHLASSLEHRLSGYALAVSAAGVSLLALAQPSEAKIVYTKAHKVIGENSSFLLDLNQDGAADFGFSNYYHEYTSRGSAKLVITPAKQAGVMRHAAPLSQGVRIGPGRNFYERPKNMASYVRFCTRTTQGTSFCRTATDGDWVNVAHHYLGLRFVINGMSHYGWARFNVNVARHRITATLTGYAYETIPNKAIIAGKTKGPDVITLQNPSLGHLARGASAMRAWRGASAAK